MSLFSKAKVVERKDVSLNRQPTEAIRTQATLSDTYEGMPVIDPALVDDNAGNNVTKTIGGKAVLRPSSINIHCWYSYAQNAILLKKSKPKGASQLGTTYHYAMELGTKAFLKTGNLPKTNDLVELAMINWSYALNKGIDFAPKDDPSKMSKDLVTGVRSYNVGNFTNAKVAEVRLNMPLPKESLFYSEISGSVDRIDVRGDKALIVDYKLTSKKVTANKYRFQAGLYAKMLQHSFGELYNSGLFGNAHITSIDAELHNAVRGRDLKSGYVGTEQHKVVPTMDNLTFTNIEGRINEIVDKGNLTMLLINSGVDKEDAVKLVYPTTSPEQDYLCSPVWCGWWDICPINNPEQQPKVDLVKMALEIKNDNKGVSNGII